MTVPHGRVWSRISARAPVRVDFGGGWTDVPPYPEEQGGFVTSVAIARYATASIVRDAPPSDPAAESEMVRAVRRRLPALSASIALNSDVPVGSGLGGSSALSVALLAAMAAIDDERVDRRALAERSRHFEVDELGISGGWQDHYSAALGGALAMRFAQTNLVTSIPLAPHTIVALEGALLLYYTGASRLSATTIDGVRARYQQHDQGTRAALATMRRLAEAMARSLEAGDIPTLGALVGEHWLHQQTLHSGVSTPQLDRMIDLATREGAFGAKALGASGGGCLIIIAPPDRHDALQAALDPLGMRLPVRIDQLGCQVTVE